MMEIGGYTRPCLGEIFNGDQLVIETGDSLVLVAIIDGLGHGDLAAEMSNEVHRIIMNMPFQSPIVMIEELHQKLQGKLGAVIGLGILEDEQFTYVGLGNINCRIFGDRDRSFRNTNGVLGLRKGQLKEQVEYIERNDILVMTSDGISHRLAKEEILKLNYLNVHAMAKRMVDLFGENYDDASVVIIRNKDGS